MSKLDLEWLKVFDAVWQTASVSKAAERLGIAQAAASTALNKLRAHFEDRLFERTAGDERVNAAYALAFPAAMIAKILIVQLLC